LSSTFCLAALQEFGGRREEVEHSHYKLICTAAGSVRKSPPTNEEPIMNVYGAYSTVAAVSALAAFLLGWGSIKTLSHITDSGMWAITVMAMAPALMGIGVSFFICLSHRAEPPRERRLPPDEPLDPGAFTPSRR
jgi:hypothetical protein